ncbi:MAG: hypothetical protein ABR520_01555 [Mycobacteriales bacterium]|nr:hypothetical protein [Frankia sp.]
MRRSDAPEVALDYRLAVAPLYAGIPAAALATLLGALTAGGRGAVAALVGVGVVVANAVAAALISARGARSTRGIDIPLVVGMLPVRLLLLGVAIAVGVGPLDLPRMPLVVSVCATEVGVLLLQCLLVLRGTTFLGPFPKEQSAT